MRLALFSPVLSLGASLGLFLNFLGLDARAASLHETLYFSGSPSPELVSSWSALPGPGPRSFLIDAGDPSTSELEPIALLRGADRIQIEVQSYPNEDALAAWKNLASQGVELVVLNKPGLPTEDEVRRLNEADFSRCTFVISYYPGLEEAHRLSKLHCRLSLTLAIAAYPKVEDKPGLMAIPASVPLLFATDYWPWYSHMDLFNQLPHRLRLRVVDMLPPADAVQYLHGIRNLDETQVVTESDPESDEWRKFEGLPLTWSSLNHVPSAEALGAFSKSGGALNPRRKLVIDSDIPWTAEERERIQQFPSQVEWIHSAPSLQRNHVPFAETSPPGRAKRWP